MIIVFIIGKINPFVKKNLYCVIMHASNKFIFKQRARKLITTNHELIIQLSIF